MKKYVDIERCKESYASTFEVGESIVIEEKIDGANCSFLYDAESDTVKIFSRRQELTPDNTLQGAYGWGQSLNKDVVREVLGNRYVVFGEWLCLSGDTVIRKVSAGKGKKEMTLKEMYEYANTPEEGRTKSWWERNGYPSLYSLDLETDTIQPNKMQKIIYTGKKKVYRLTTHKGYSIKATANHPFLTPKGWVELGKLSEYDCVAITDFITRSVHQRTYGVGTREIFKKQKEYKDRIGKCEVCGVTNGLNLHHKDENPFHNTEDNWQVLCQDCHGKTHTKFNNQPKFDYEFDYIISIEDAGEEDCYDICMSGNENVANFIANNFIVHNCKHTVVYPDSCYKKFYMFDVWDTETEQYLPFKEAVRIYLDLTQDSPEVPFSFVPVLYVGFYESYEKLLELVGTTKLGGEMGEGIVIKRQGKLDSKSSRDPFYIKILSEKFSEVHDSKPRKPVDPAVVAAAEVAQAEIATIVTERRVEKMILKLIDEGIIPQDWDEKNMRDISRVLPKRIWEDIVKEEPEIVAKYENFGKIAGGLTMKYVKKMI